MLWGALVVALTTATYSVTWDLCTGDDDRSSTHVNIDGMAKFLAAQCTPPSSSVRSQR